MDVTKRIELLRDIDLFENFSDEDLAGFAEHVKEFNLEHDQVLFNEGSPGNEMYILLKGSLKVYKESRFITVIKPVDYIGEMAIIESKPRSATVQAIRPSVLLEITQKQFQDYLSRQPESLVSLMRTLSQRIRKNTEIIAEEFEKTNILIHDMKNFMSSFLFLDLMESHVESDAARRYIKNMKNGRDNLAQMMTEALANAKRLQHPRTYAEDSLIDLVTDMKESELNVHPDLMDRQVNIIIRNQIPDFPFCKLEIRRAFFNLVLNGAQACKPGDSVDIELDADDGNAIIKFTDKGEGIPLQYKEKIFETHFTTKPEGNGLGLASCKHVVENLHGGTISFESRQDIGTTFTVILPLKQTGTVAG